MAVGDVNQIYTVVNEAYKQTSGRTDVAVVDTASLVAVGAELEAMQKMDIWLNSLSRMIGKSIDDFRAYTGQFSDMKRDEMQWGAFVRKYHMEMPEAREDDTVKVGQMDGQSLDQYIIANPKVKQKIFNVEAPYSFFITTQRKWLKEAFRSESEMTAFINSIYNTVQNKIEVTHENLGRLALANLIATTTDPRVFPLVTMYNANRSDQVEVGAEALTNKEFIAFAMAIMLEVKMNMRTMGVLYNEEEHDRHTPDKLSRLALLSGFNSALTSIAQRNTFNPNYGVIEPNIVVPYWQGNKRPDGSFMQNSKISVKAAWNNNGKRMEEEKEIENVIAVLYDYEAVGTFRQEEDVLTTPVNARGAYFNTFWHENQMYFNDHGENCVVFTLN